MDQVEQCRLKRNKTMFQAYMVGSPCVVFRGIPFFSFLKRIPFRNEGWGDVPFYETIRIIGVKVKVPQLLCYDNSEMELDFPSSWSMFFRPMKGEIEGNLPIRRWEKSSTSPLSQNPFMSWLKGRRRLLSFLMIWRGRPLCLKPPLLCSGNWGRLDQ